MRCNRCTEPAGWLRRTCKNCSRLVEVFEANRGADMATLMDHLMATGVGLDAIERFLDSDYEGSGSVRDHIAADMTNELLAAFGQRARKTPAEVQRIRKRGAWVHLDRPPEE